jgi:hypothetical protein
MTAAGFALNDEGATRWTFPELCFWLNEGIRALVLARPFCASKTITLTMQAGTYQEVPIEYLTLLRLTRNISDVGPPRVGGRAIRITTHDALDASCPEWHNPKIIKYSPQVRQFIFDDDDPRSFYVYPGNDGTGVVEGIVSALPCMVVATGDIDTLASYAVDVDVKDIYQPPLLDYVLYRAMSKDDTDGNPAGAASHLQAFIAAVGADVQVAGADSPNAQPNEHPKV